MRKTLVSLFLVITSLAVLPHTAYAYKTGGVSAQLASKTQNPVIQQLAEDNLSYALKKTAILAVLKRYDSPLIASVDDLIEACRVYKIDCYLLPSIAGLESTFGLQMMPNSHNPYGWAQGLLYFRDWKEGHMTVAKGLREKYADRGLHTIEEIGPVYSESSTWAARVSTIRRWFVEEEQKNKLFFAIGSVKL